MRQLANGFGDVVIWKCGNVMMECLMADVMMSDVRRENKAQGRKCSMINAQYSMFKGEKG